MDSTSACRACAAAWRRRASDCSRSRRCLGREQLVAQVQDLLGEVGVVLLHDVDELDAVRQVGERRGAQIEPDVGRRALHVHLGGPLVQPDARCGANRASAASRSSRVACRFAVTSSSRPVASSSSAQRLGELRLDRAELGPRGRQLRLRAIDAPAGPPGARPSGSRNRSRPPIATRATSAVETATTRNAMEMGKCVLVMCERLPIPDRGKGWQTGPTPSQAPPGSRPMQPSSEPSPARLESRPDLRRPHGAGPPVPGLSAQLGGEIGLAQRLVPVVALEQIVRSLERVATAGLVGTEQPSRPPHLGGAHVRPPPPGTGHRTRSRPSPSRARSPRRPRRAPRGSRRSAGPSTSPARRRPDAPRAPTSTWRAPETSPAARRGCAPARRPST